MVYSKSFVAQELERLRKIKRDPILPSSYQEHMPETLGFEPFDQTMRFQNLDNIDSRGKQATELIQTQAENQRAMNELARQKQIKERAKRRLERTKARQPKNTGPRITGGQINWTGSGKGAPVAGGGVYTGNTNFGKKWGKDNTPEVSDLKRIRPHAMLVGANYRGRYFVVNSQVKDIFIALLDDLWRSGYRPKIIGGYNKRNIAGTNTPSLHSYGLAIDIDPTRNPVQYGSNRHALPKNVSALAAKYGLSWGGDWNSYKDPMHFSVPYGGTK